MVQFNYANLAQIVDKNLKRFGRKPNKTLLRPRTGADIVVTAIEADFTSSERPLVQRDDLKFLVSAVSLTAIDQDEYSLVLVDDAGAETDYVIVSEPKRTGPGGTNVFWQLHVRSR